MNRMHTGLHRIRNRSQTLLYADLTNKIIGLAYEIQNQYGSGQKESVYQNALAEKLSREKISFKQEYPINILSLDSGNKLGTHRLDFVVDEKVIVEVKAVKFTPAKLEQQLYSYLRNSPYEVGLMINLGSSRVFVRRIILTHHPV